MNELVSSLRSFATWRVLRASISCGLVASVVGCGSSGSAPELYPTRDTYLDAVNASTQSAVDGGYLLPVDAALIVAWAEASDIGAP